MLVKFSQMIFGSRKMYRDNLKGKALRGYPMPRTKTPKYKNYLNLD